MKGNDESVWQTCN